MRYGQDLIVDLHGCDTSTFTRKSIRGYCIGLCKLIDMKREDLYFWDDKDVPKKYKQTEEHTSGISAIQFILTSNITIHTLDLLANAYIDIFSCKNFNTEDALGFTKDWFKGTVKQSMVFDRM
jgi:S-adenosylmethionine/arginine decarboxylase-like enzyme